MSDVRASSEHVRATGNDDGSHAGIGIVRFERVYQFAHQRPGQGIELLRTVERDDAYRTVHSREDKLVVGHAPPGYCLDSGTPEDENWSDHPAT